MNSSSYGNLDLSYLSFPATEIPIFVVYIFGRSLIFKESYLSGYQNISMPTMLTGQNYVIFGK